MVKANHFLDPYSRSIIKLWYGLHLIPWYVVKLTLLLIYGRRNYYVYVSKFLALHPARAYSFGRGRFIHLYYEHNVDKVIKNSLKPGSVFIDIGANQGTYTILALSIRDIGVVVAVDPDPRIYRYLRAHPVLKDSSAQILNKAVWLSDSKAKLTLGKSTVATSLTPLQRAVKENHFLNMTVECETIRLDTLVNKFPKVDLIKMDIEGAEYHVLTDPMLDLQKVDALIIEMHYALKSIEANEIINMLKNHRYRIYIISPSLLKSSPLKYHLFATRNPLQW
ncbi:MAG: FkbM family methyltransferase [Candidatus Caldarchaeum sp.]